MRSTDLLSWIPGASPTFRSGRYGRSHPDVSHLQSRGQGPARQMPAAQVPLQPPDADVDAVDAPRSNQRISEFNAYFNHIESYPSYQ